MSDTWVEAIYPVILLLPAKTQAIIFTLKKVYKFESNKILALADALEVIHTTGCQGVLFAMLQE